MTHLERVRRTIDYIEKHLNDDLPVDLLAGIAAFSLWHFQRVFSAMTGQTVACYIRRRRLASAAAQLAGTRRKIVEIAWEHRFESQEAFTRAFKAMFGSTPGQYRRENTRPDEGLCMLNLTQEYLDSLYGEIAMEPVLRHMEEFKVVGMGSRFISILSPDSTSSNVIGGLWDVLFKRIGEIRNTVQGPSYGLCEMLPPGEQAHQGECFYLAGAAVDSLDDIPGGMVGRSVPESQYLCFTHTGKLDTLATTMGYIYGVWLPKSGYERGPGPDVELYDERFDPQSDTSEMDILIPVRNGA